RWMDDPAGARTLQAWRGSLVKAVVGNWKDGDKRRALLSDHKTPAQLADAAAIAARVAEAERRSLEERRARRELVGGPRKSEPPPPPKDQAGAVLALIRGIG